MVSLEFLQEAGRRAIFKRVSKGLSLPGKSRTIERTPEKQALLLRAVRDAYRRTPPRLEDREGVRVLILPWMLP